MALKTPVREESAHKPLRSVIKLYLSFVSMERKCITVVNPNNNSKTETRVTANRQRRYTKCPYLLYKQTDID